MMRKISFIISMISFVLSLLVFTLFLTNQEKPLTRIFKESLSSVVEVRAYTADLESFGTAVILSNGKLVTNFHIISYTNQSKTYVHNNIEIRFSDSEIYQNVEIKHYDVNLDLAMLELTKIQGKSFEVNIAEIFTGQKIFLMGNGNNLGISLTSGIISRSEVEISFNGNINKYIQIDAISTNGVSGGALLDENGKIIGMITLRLLDTNGTPIYGYVYAIPMSTVLNFIDSFS